jgi:hypothetical protein
VNDTSAVAQSRYDELLRAQTPAERLAIAMSLTRAVRTVAVAGIRAAHPNASAGEVDARLVARLYGPEIARRIFGTAAP